MGRLRYQDTQKLLAAIAILHSEVNPATLAQRTLGAIHKIISTDYISFDGFAFTDITARESEQASELDSVLPQTGLVRRDSESWYNYEFNVTFDELMIVDKYSHEFPMFREVILKNIQTPAKTTDFTSPREFHRTTVYNALYRKVESDFHLGLMLPTSSEIRMYVAWEEKIRIFPKTNACFWH